MLHEVLVLQVMCSAWSSDMPEKKMERDSVPPARKTYVLPMNPQRCSSELQDAMTGAIDSPAYIVQYSTVEMRGPSVYIIALVPSPSAFRKGFFRS